MERLGQWIVSYRLPILGITLLVVLGAGSALPRLRIDVSSRNLVFVDDKVRDAFQRYLDEWGSDRYTTLAVRFTHGDAFTAERLAFIRSLTERLRKVDMVDKVDSITSTTVMSARGDTLFVGPLVPEEIPTAPAALEAIKKRSLESPLMQRMLLDARGTMVGINIRMRDPGHDESLIMQAAKEVRRIQDSVKRPPGVELYQMGGPAMMAVMYDMVQRDLWVLGVAPIVLVFLILLVVFRSLRGAILPLVTVLSTGVITFGCMVITGHRVNMVTTMLPCLLMVISVASVIHVLVQQREAVAQGAGRVASVVIAVGRVGLPCLLTGLTTAAGFGSLVLSDVPQVREFGLFAAVGVLVAMLLGVISVPAALTFLPKPDPVAARKLSEGLLARFLVRLHGWSHRRVLVIAVSVAAAIFGAAGLTRLEAESSTREYLPKNHPLRAEFEMVESNLQGGVAIILHVQDKTPHAEAELNTEGGKAGAHPDHQQGSEGKKGTDKSRGERGKESQDATTAGGDDEVMDDPDEVMDDPEARSEEPATRSVGRESLKRPEVLHVLDEIIGRIERLPFVRKTISITEYLKEVNRVMHGGDSKHFVLPKDRRILAAYLEMAAGQDRDGLSKLVSFEYSKANVTIMMGWPNTKKIRELIALTREHLDRPEVKDRLGPGVSVEITGLAPMLSHVADRMVDGQIKSFFAALGVICLMMILMLWSFKVGILAMLPSVLPILITMGFMGWVGITLNTTTVMIASVALGIAVDDTIHVLVRMRNETREAGGDHSEGARRTILSVGRAVVFTSVVLSGGFAILLMASLVPAAHFGILVSFTMVTALLADLVLTPTLIYMASPWAKRKQKTPASLSDEGGSESPPQGS